MATVLSCVSLLGLINQVVGNIPKEHVSVVTSSDDAVLTIVKIFLDFLLRGKFAQKDRLASIEVAPCTVKNITTSFLSDPNLAVGIAFCSIPCVLSTDGTFDLLLDVSDRQLFFLHVVRPSMITSFIEVFGDSYIVDVFLGELAWANFALKLLRKILLVLPLKEPVKLDTANKVAMACTSHYRNDVYLVAIVFDLKVVCNKRIIFIANRKHRSIR